MQPYLPLGTLYAAALLRQHGFSVAVFDAMLEDPKQDSLPLWRAISRASWPFTKTTSISFPKCASRACARWLTPWSKLRERQEQP